MKKNIKILLFAGIGVAALAAAAALLLLFPPAASESETTESETTVTEDQGELLFTEKTTGEVVSIAIKTATDNYTMEIENGTGTIPELLTASVNTTEITNTVTVIASLKARQLVERDSAEPPKYGFDGTQSEVKVTFSDGTSVDFEVGLEASAMSSTYIRRKGSNDIYIAYTSEVEKFKREKYFYVNTKVMADYDEETSPVVARLTVKKDGEADVVIDAITKVEGAPVKSYNTHKITEPVQVELEQEASRNVVYGMFGLTALEAVWVGMEEKDYEVSGLNSPSAVIEMKVGVSTYTLTLGYPIVTETDDGNGGKTQSLKGYYGMFSETPDVLYIFAPSSLPWLNMDFNSLMSSLFLMPYIYDIENLKIELTDKTLDLSLKSTLPENADEDDEEEPTYTYFSNGAEIEESRYKKLYQFIIGAKGETIYNEPVTEPFAARFTYTYFDKSIPDDVVEFYQTDDRRLIIRVNGETRFKCRAMYYERLLQNIDAFLNGGEINNNW